MFDKQIDTLKGALKGMFQERALTDKERDEFEAEIQFSAKRAGFRLRRTSNEGIRVFHRDLDNATATMPVKDKLQRRDRILLHGFDGYL